MYNKKTVVPVEIQRSQLAVIGLSNVSVIDTRVNKLNNDYQDFVDTVRHNDSNTPLFGSAIQAKNATAANIVALDQSNLTLEDKLVVITLPSGFRPKLINDAIAGLLIAEKYMEFTQGGTHSVDIQLMKGIQLDAINSRNLVVEPTSGVNTVSEYVVLPTIQPQTLGPVQNLVYNAGLIPVPSSYAKSAGNYLTPWPISAPYVTSSLLATSYSQVVIIFRGMKDQGNISVTPIFTGVIAAKMVADIMNT